MKKLMIILGLVVVVGVGYVLLSPEINGTKDLQFIKYTEAFEQAPDDYYVYFWQEGCRFCIEFDPFLTAAAKEGVPIFVIDLNEGSNTQARIGEGEDFNERPQSPDEFTITGTPTLLRITDGVTVGYGVGVDEGVAMLMEFPGFEAPASFSERLQGN